MMHQDSLEPAAIRFTLERLQESASHIWFLTEGNVLYFLVLIWCIPIEAEFDYVIGL